MGFHRISNIIYQNIVYRDYSEGFSIIEFIGEWNDIITNDIMLFKREVVDVLISNGINKFVLIGENILNIHIEDDEYYHEWYNDLEIGGWIVPINFREHVLQEIYDNFISDYFDINELFNDLNWRKLEPEKIIDLIEEVLVMKLN